MKAAAEVGLGGRLAARCNDRALGARTMPQCSPAFGGRSSLGRVVNRVDLRCWRFGFVLLDGVIGRRCRFGLRLFCHRGSLSGLCNLSRCVVGCVALGGFFGGRSVGRVGGGFFGTIATPANRAALAGSCLGLWDVGLGLG